MKRFLGSFKILVLLVFTSCSDKHIVSMEHSVSPISTDKNVDQSIVKIENRKIVKIKKDKRVIEIPYHYLKVSELMSVLEVESKGVGDVNAYGQLTAWIGWKYPYEFTFLFPDSNYVANYYISEDSIVDLTKIYVRDLEVWVRNKSLKLDLSKDTIVIN